MSKPSDISAPITANGNPNAVPQVPEPEMLSRNDLSETTRAKAWSITGVQPQRGEPATSIDGRQMFVPMYDTEHSRTIRAHEMVHAKVSPTARQFDKWVKRGYATAQAMIQVEELRVNLLAEQAGFQPASHLADGSEYLAGQRTAEVCDFRSAVWTAVSFRICAGYEPFMAGIASVKPDWCEHIEGITSTAEQYLRNIINNEHAYPTLHATHSRLHLSGFCYVENIASWMEELVGAMTNNEKGEPQGKPSDKSKSGGSQQDEEEEGKSPQDAMNSKKQEGTGWHTRGEIPVRGKEDVWEELRVATPALERNVIGAIGRKRIATNMGRNPRRMSRLLTDPDKRIFDRVVKGAGGVVLIDTSGSMSLSQEQVMEIVLNAPSALVAMYSGGKRSRDNLWVVANRGKCVNTLPNPNGGNGVDAPAIKWALSKRQNANAPVIWVSDGGVTGKSDSWGTSLVMECISLVKRNGIYTVEEPEQAIAMLKAMAKGEKVRSIVPQHLAQVYQSQTGHTLTFR